MRISPEKLKKKMIKNKEKYKGRTIQMKDGSWFRVIDIREDGIQVEPIYMSHDPKKAKGVLAS